MVLQYGGVDYVSRCIEISQRAQRRQQDLSHMRVKAMGLRDRRVRISWRSCQWLSRAALSSNSAHIPRVLFVPRDLSMYERSERCKAYFRT